MMLTMDDDYSVMPNEALTPTDVSQGETGQPDASWMQQQQQFLQGMDMVSAAYSNGGLGGDSFSKYTDATPSGNAVAAASGNINSDVAPALGANWLGEGFNKAMSFFDSSNDKTGQRGAALVTLGGSFLSGLFGNAAKERAAALAERKVSADEKTSDTQRMVADAAIQKVAASQIGKTNFGVPTGLIGQPAPIRRNRVA